MNNEFEKRLEQQEFRGVPASWRREILAPVSESVGFNWRQLFWPCPQAWAGLAAVWVLILTVDLAMREKSPAMVVEASAPARTLIVALKEQQETLIRLVEPPDNSEAEPPRRGLQHRSELPGKSAMA